MKTISTSLALVCFMFIAAGCASITRGWSDVLEIHSEPVGADVTIEVLNPEEASIEGAGTCKTPCAKKADRESELRVLITKEGCDPVEVEVTNKTVGAGGLGMAGNIILGGGIGAIVDASSGATQDLTPNPIDVKLVCED